MDINSFVIGYKKGKASVPSGGGSGGGVELNIAYGDTAPEDTTKLWVKTTQPSGVVVSTNVEKQDVGTTAEVGEIPIDPALTRYLSAQGVVGTKAYFFGGGKTKSDPREDHDSILRYDATTNTFTTLSVTLPVASEGHGRCVDGTKIYLFGGYTHRKKVSLSHTYHNTIQCFDTETETLTTLSATWPMTSEFGDGSPVCSKVGSKIYLIAKGKVHYFDTETENLTTLSTTFSALKATQSRYTGSAVAGDKIYLFSVNTKTTICCFDTATESLTTLSAKLPGSPTSSLDFATGVAIIGANIYICISYTSSPGISAKPILLFDVETNTISKVVNLTDLGIGFIRAGTFMAFGTKFYVVENSDASFITAEIVPKYDVLLAHEALQIIPGIGANSFPVINESNAKVEIGVNKVYKGNIEGIGEEVEAALYKDGAWTTI